MSVTDMNKGDIDICLLGVKSINSRGFYEVFFVYLS